MDITNSDASADEPPVHTVHRELHHYTDWVGLKGIVESRQLWATRWDGLNDSSEIEYFRTFAAKALAARIRRIAIKATRDSLRQKLFIKKSGGYVKGAQQDAEGMLDALYRITFKAGRSGEPFAPPYIFSLCGHRDDDYAREHGLLSQWRGYGGEQRYALVFDARKLSETLQREWKQYEYAHLSIGDVIYNEASLDFPKRFLTLLDSLGEAWRSGLEEDQRLAVGKAFSPLMGSAPRFKHRGFREELEVRIVAAPISAPLLDYLQAETNKNSVKAIKSFYQRARDLRQVHFLKLFEDSKKQLPLRRIIVGPSADQKRHAEAAKKLVRGKVPINFSETPYIG